MGAQIIEVASTIFDLIPSLFQSLSSIFWDAEAGTLTFIGTLAILGLGMTLCWVAFRVIRGFMHLRG